MSDGRISKMTLVLNRAGVSQLSNDKKTQIAFESIGQKIADRALGYGGLFSRKRWFTETSKGRDGVVVRAGTDQPAAHWDEWGNIYRAPRAPLRRALQSLGLWSKTTESSG